MKKFLFFLFFFFLSFSFVMADNNWDNCPYNKINEPAPGTCPRYIDIDKDNVCDFSQPSPNERKMAKLTNVDFTSFNMDEEKIVDSEDLISGKDLKTKKVYEIAEIYNIRAEDYANSLSKYLKVKIKLTDDFQLLHDNFGLEPSVAKDFARSLANGEKEISGVANQKEQKSKSRYKLVIITIVFVIVYLFSLLLVKINLITLLEMRKFWNSILLLSFFITVLLGVLLIIRINFGWYINLPFNILYWHVELGTVMADVAIIHIVWHWRYYLNIIKGK